MNQVGTMFQIEDRQATSRKAWFYFFILALLFHLLLFTFQLDWMGQKAKPRVEVQTIDPKKLDAVRKQWKEKGLLLNKDKSQPKEKEAPPDARYFSDRNIHVEKEQRAKDTNVIPKPGSPEASSENANRSKEAAKPKPKTKPAPHQFPKLGNLGIPLPKLDTPKRITASEHHSQSPQHASSGQQGGEQALNEKNLPVGSENLLNAQESVFYSFFARLYETIGPIWQSRIREVPNRRRVGPGEYSTVVDVVLDRSGNLIEVRRIQPSGIEEFDEAVNESWKRVGRFPNPPQDLLDQQEQVHTGWTFTVQIADGINLRSLPPERNY